MNKYLPVLFFLFCCSCKTHLHSDRSNVPDDKVYRLRIDPPSGSKYVYDVNNDSKTKMEITSDKTVENAKKADVTINYGVEKDSSGNFVISITYDKIKIWTKNGDQETDLSSENTDDTGDLTEKMLHSLKEATIIATVNREGRIKTVNGYSEVASKVLAQAGSVSLPDKEKMMQQWQTMVEQTMIKKNMDQLFRIFPDSAVHIGDRWKLTTRDSAGIAFSVKTVYTLSSIKDGIAEIASQGEVATDSAATVLSGMGDATADLSGQQRGSYLIDIKTGMMSECKIATDIEGKVQVMGRDIPITISTEMRMNGRKIK